MLSKSVGDLSSSDLLRRNRKQAARIKHSGYLLKRSNDPWKSSNIQTPPIAIRSSNNPIVEPPLNELSTGLAPPATATISRPINNTTTNWLSNGYQNPPSTSHPNTRLIPPQPPQPIPRLDGDNGIKAHDGSGRITNVNNPLQTGLSIPDLSLARSEAAESIASFFGQDASLCYKMPSHTQQQQTQEINTSRSFDGEQSAPELLGNNSFQNYSLNANSSESSHIPPLQKSLTQPIAIASTNSEDSEDSNYNHKRNNYYDTTNMYSRQPIISNNKSNYDFLKPLNVSRPPAYVRMTSEPVIGSNESYPPPPENYIDKKDRHIWKAQYCVLEDGVLYFYTDAETGNSLAAQEERSMSATLNNTYGGYGYPENNNSHNYKSKYYNNCPPTAVNVKNVKEESYEPDHYLAKSPMPRKSYMELNSKAKESNGREGSHHGTDVIWVKRVALNMVGNVRSNTDYGKRVFELLAINYEEESDVNGGALDRLLLRATSEDDMNFWIFQIHRSFITLMKQIAEYVGGHDGLSVSERMSNKLLIDSCGKNSSPLNPVLGHSPFNESSLKAGVGTLSHGHGRSIRHRKSKKEENSNFTNEKVSSSTHLAASPTHYIANTMTSRLRSQSYEKLQTHGDAQEVISESDMSDVMLYSPSPSMRDYKSPNNTPAMVTMASQSIVSSSFSGHTISTQKYIPPQKRKANNKNNPKLDQATADALAEQVRSEDEEIFSPIDNFNDEIATENQEEPMEVVNLALGGCADPTLIDGSICDEKFIKEKASKVEESADGPFGCRANNLEIGATSTLGVRYSNEDSYLIVNDLLDGSSLTEADSFFRFFSEKRSLFAIFDGHCGNHAARFAAEKLRDILVEESRGIERDDNGQNDDPQVRKILNTAISRLDREFCELCSVGGRQWISGSTAIIAIFLNEKLFVANVGDCGGIICCSSPNYNKEQNNDWEILDLEISESLENNESNDTKMSEENFEIIWREISQVHTPSQPEEKQRIESANGWTLIGEQEVVIASQFQTIREHLTDEDVRSLFLRWFSDRSDSSHARIYNVWRVCGDLSVSRAIGDFEYKAAYGTRINDNSWASDAPFDFPSNHSRYFTGDLIISTPDIKSFEVIGDERVLLLACDGFWDVLDADDAVRLIRRLIFERGFNAWESAQRLAKLARCLGSSDNITVIIVQF